MGKSLTNFTIKQFITKLNTYLEMFETGNHYQIEITEEENTQFEYGYEFGDILYSIYLMVDNESSCLILSTNELNEKTLKITKEEIDYFLNNT